MGGGLNPPMEVVLSWKSNYIDPVTHGKGLVIMEGVLLGLCYLAVGLRVYTRAITAKNFGIDDALIVFNLIPLTGLAVCLILAFEKYGWNRHIWDIPPEMMVQARKDAMGIEITYLISTCTTKISILLFYRRLGGAVSPKFRWTVYAAIAFVVAYMLTCFINSFVQCRPLSAFWDRGNVFWVAAHQGDWYCVDEAATVVAASVISMVQDFIACLLPLALFARLRISYKQKIALAGIFGIGFFLCICGVLRLIATVKVYYQTYDLTWESLNVWVWTGIESHMAVVCASLPALNHFFRHILKESSVTGGFMSWSSKHGGSGSGIRSKGYDRSTSRTGSELAYDARRPRGNQKALHVVQDVKLEEFLDDKRYDLYPGGDTEGRWERGTNFIDEETIEPPQSSRTWLEDDTSGDDSPSRRPEEPGRKYSGFADTRRFY